MDRVKQHNKSDSFDRDIYSISIASLNDLPTLGMPSKYFATLVALDARNISVNDLVMFFRNLISQGCVYICAWGPRSVDTEEAADYASIYKELDGGIEQPVIMTTSHSNDELGEALWFLTNSAKPDNAYNPECKCALVISVGNDIWSNEINDYFAN